MKDNGGEHNARPQRRRQHNYQVYKVVTTTTTTTTTVQQQQHHLCRSRSSSSHYVQNQHRRHQQQQQERNGQGRSIVTATRLETIVVAPKSRRRCVGNSFVRLRFLLLVWLVTTATTVGGSSSGSSSSSPFRTLENSLAASAAQGTTVALQFQTRLKQRQQQEQFSLSTSQQQQQQPPEDSVSSELSIQSKSQAVASSSSSSSSSPLQDAILIVLRSPGGKKAPPLQQQQQQQQRSMNAPVHDFLDKDWIDCVSDPENSSMTIRIHPILPSPLQQRQRQLQQRSGRWTVLGNQQALLCLTGFSVDVDYMTAVVQQRVDQHALVYDCSHVPSAITILILQCLSGLLSQKAAVRDGRPFGIQALVVGQQQQHRRLTMFTLDPTGNYRHWGTATAIGRDASTIRKALYTQLQQQQQQQKQQPQQPVNENEMEQSGSCPPPRGCKAALKLALRAMMMDGSSNSINKASTLSDTDRYEALVIWQPSTAANEDPYPDDGSHGSNRGLSMGWIDPVTVAAVQEEIRAEVLSLQTNT